MANYPLSHISVGGNTYDISHATILTCTIDAADFASGAYLADAWLKGAADDLSVLSYSGKTLTDAYDDLVAGHPVYLAIEVNSSICDIIPLSVDAGGWQKIFYGVVSTTGHIYSFKVFDAAMMDDFPTKISKVADSASGGGGGGSSAIKLSLRDTTTVAMAFAGLSPGTDFKLYESTNSEYYTITKLMTAIKAGTPIAIVDRDNSTSYIFYGNGLSNYFSFEYIEGGIWSPTRMCVIAEGSSTTFSARTRKTVTMS